MNRVFHPLRLTAYKAALAAIVMLFASCEKVPDKTCDPTPYDEIGPFYRPGAPERNKVGSGFFLRGQVLSSKDCRPLANSRIEFWQVNPQGEYDDAHRATVYADLKGRYTFESNKPIDYVGRLPHIHMMIHAKGHEQLITQYYPKRDETDVRWDLVLEPEEQR